MDTYTAVLIVLGFFVLRFALPLGLTLGFGYLINRLANQHLEPQT